MIEVPNCILICIRVLVNPEDEATTLVESEHDLAGDRRPFCTNPYGRLRRRTAVGSGECVAANRNPRCPGACCGMVQVRRTAEAGAWSGHSRATRQNRRTPEQHLSGTVFHGDNTIAAVGNGSDTAEFCNCCPWTS